MTSTCPFCNGVLPSLSALPNADKRPCPRCGEPVPAARWQVETSIASGPPKAQPRPTPSAGNRKTLLIVLSIMVAMAIIGLSYALWTVKLRRSRDPKVLLDPVTIRRPLELEGMGYLPKDNHVIVGLHLAEWLDDKTVGKPLLEEPRPALLDWVVKQSQRMTGLPLEEIDHVVLAASFDTLQATMVVKTRRPYSLERIAEHAKRSKTPMHQEKALYEIPINPIGGALIWCVDEKTLVGVIRLDEPKVDHLQGLSTTPRKMEEVLSAPLRKAMRERLPKQTFLWAVGGLDQLGMLNMLLPLVPAAKAKLEVVKDLKVFALGLEPVEGLTMTGHFQLTDANAAAKFKTVLEGVKIDGAKSQKVEAPPADAQEQWLTWQVRGDVAVVREWMNVGKDGKK